MAALFEQTFAIGSAHVTTANAGKYDGTGSQTIGTGTGAGAAPSGAYNRYIRIACRGSNNANTYRFFTKIGGVSTFQFEISIPKNDALVYVNGIMNPAFVRDYPIPIELPSTSYTLEVNAEVVGDADVSFHGKSYV